jgi:hypothetical protein
MLLDYHFLFPYTDISGNNVLLWGTKKYIKVGEELVVTEAVALSSISHLLRSLRKE